MLHEYYENRCKFHPRERREKSQKTSNRQLVSRLNLFSDLIEIQFVLIHPLKKSSSPSSSSLLLETKQFDLICPSAASYVSIDSLTVEVRFSSDKACFRFKKLESEWSDWFADKRLELIAVARLITETLNCLPTMFV